MKIGRKLKKWLKRVALTCLIIVGIILLDGFSLLLIFGTHSFTIQT